MAVKTPKEWRNEPLGDLGEFMKCKGGSKKDEVPQGVPVIRYGQLYTRYGTVIKEFYSFVTAEHASNYTQLKYGDLLFAGSGETLEEIGKAAVVLADGPAHAGGDLILVRPSFATDPLFLGYCVNGSETSEQKRRFGQGSSVFHISADRLANVRISLPPLPEQKKIAAILSSVDEAIQATQRVIDQTRRVKEGLLQDLLTRGMPGHTRFKQTEIGEIPESWEVLPLSAVVSVCTYGFTNPMPTTATGPWMVTAANVVDGRIDYLHTRRTSEEAYNHALSDKSKPAVGDVLVTKDGSLGRVAIVDRGGICINQSVAVLRPSSVSSTFLMYLLQSPPWQERMLADAGGSTIKHIYISRLAKLLVVVPPLEERELIVTRLDASTKLIRSQVEKLQSLHSLKAGLLQDLLTGKVRVSP